MEVEAKDQYVKNIQNVISGEFENTTPTTPDTASKQVVTRGEIDLYKSSDATKQIIGEFESLPLE
ncbi:hypothetical protein R0J90_20385, partial [Micrococcus sp. SIMBA_144]